MKFQTSDDLCTGFSGERCIFAAGSRQEVFTNQKEYAVLLQAAALWKTAATKKTVTEQLIALGHSLSETTWAVHYLISKRHVVPATPFIADSRYARHLLYYSAWNEDPNLIQQRLAAAHVIVVGCGGIGNHVSSHLAAAGIGSITLVDTDFIELSNLTRQTHFTEADVGRKKVTTLAAKLRAINSEIGVRCIDLYLSTSDDFFSIPHADVVVLSADEPSGLVDLCNAQFVARRQPFINAGYVGDIAVFGPFVIPGSSGCMACNRLTSFDHTDDPSITNLIHTINKGSRAPSFGPVNGIAASMAANDVIRFLGDSVAPLSLNKRVGIHSTMLRIEHQECERNKGCTVCGSR